MDSAVAAVLPQVDFVRKVQRTTARARLVEKIFFRFSPKMTLAVDFVAKHSFEVLYCCSMAKLPVRKTFLPHVILVRMCVLFELLY